MIFAVEEAKSLMQIPVYIRSCPKYQLKTWPNLMEALEEKQRLPVRRPGRSYLPGLWTVYDHLFVRAQLLPLEGQQYILSLPTGL